jgi:hypothetical protein
MVRLLPNDPNDPQVVTHEVGAWCVMDDLFEDNFPEFPNCDNHTPDQARSEGCAWMEGFADWYAITVFGQTAYRGFELENRHWGDGRPTGDTSRARWPVRCMTSTTVATPRARVCSAAERLACGCCCNRLVPAVPQSACCAASIR